MVRLTDRVEDDTSLQVHDVNLLLHWCRFACYSVSVTVAMTTRDISILGCSCGSARFVVACSSRDFCAATDVLVLAPLHEAGTEVIDKERQKEASHEDSSCGTFILKLAEAGVAEHQVCVGKEMDESSRDDNTRAELLQDDENNVRLRDDVEAGGENWHEHSKSTGNQDDKEQAHAKWNVVFAVRCIAGFLLSATSNAVTGNELA